MRQESAPLDQSLAPVALSPLNDLRNKSTRIWYGYRVQAERARREDRSPEGQDECEAGGLVHESRPNGHALESSVRLLVELQPTYWLTTSGQNERMTFLCELEHATKTSTRLADAHHVLHKPPINLIVDEGALRPVCSHAWHISRRAWRPDAHQSQGSAHAAR